MAPFSLLFVQKKRQRTEVLESLSRPGNDFSKLSITFSPKVFSQYSHRMHLDHNYCNYYRKRGSASYIVREVLSVREREREIQTDRERERDGSDCHHCRAKIGDEFTLSLPKIRTIGDELTLSLAKNSPLFVSPFTLPVSPFAERSRAPWWRNEFTVLSIAKNFFRPQALFPLFQMARAARWVIENPRQMIKSCPVLFFFSSKNWIKLIPKTIGNRKRDCAWGGSGW